jgi:hypothetical protein
MNGTLYVIDEIHTLFPARGWQGTPRHADFYNSQHGKLNDECVFITQNTKLVDPNFYRLAQEFHYCRNHRLLKHGKFRGNNKFVVHIYDGPASTGNEPTINTDEFKLDLEVAACYDTSAGVGMPGGGAADAAARAKGIPIWVFWACIGAVIVIVYIVFNLIIPSLTNKYVGGAVKHGTVTGQAPLPAAQPAPFSPGLPGSPGQQPETVRARIPGARYAATLGGVSVVRYSYIEGRMLVELSDGTFLDERTPSLTGVGLDHVVIDGERLQFVPRVIEAYAPPVSSPSSLAFEKPTLLLPARVGEAEKPL